MLQLEMLKTELKLNEYALKHSTSTLMTLELLNQRAMLKDMIIEALTEELTQLKGAA